MGANELALGFYLAQESPSIRPESAGRGIYAINPLLNDVACSDVATAEVGVGGVVDANAG